MNRCPVLLMAHSLDTGGTERQVAETVVGLTAAGFAPHVATFRGGGMRMRELEAVGIPVTTFAVESFRSPSLFGIARRFIGYLREHGIRVVHPFDYPTVVFATPLARVARVPLVLSSQRGERRLIPPFYRNALRFTDHIVHGIVVNCEFVRRDLVRNYGVSNNLIHTCYNGVDTAMFNPRGRTRMPGLENAACVIGTVAVLRVEKGLDTLIAAFAEVRSRHAGVKLVIVGDGECRKTLVALAERLDVGSDTLFVPPTRDVAAWYRSLDIYVLPSLSEALSNSLMEALACGCCAVASNVGGNPELVRDGETGLLFQAGNAGDLASRLEVLMLDERRREALSAAGAAAVGQMLTRAAAAARMAEIYTMLLNKLAPAAAKSFTDGRGKQT